MRTEMKRWPGLFLDDVGAEQPCRAVEVACVQIEQRADLMVSDAEQHFLLLAAHQNQFLPRSQSGGLQDFDLCMLGSTRQQ